MNRDLAKYYIDIAAGEARGKYFSSGLGQESTYLFKSFQAKEFKAANYTGTIPSLIQVEIDVTGKSPQEATDYILATEAMWVQLLAIIERIRRSGKLQIDSLTDAEEISNSCETTIKQLKSL